MNQLLSVGDLLRGAWVDYKTKVKTLALLMAGLYLFIGIVLLVSTGGSLASSYAAADLKAGVVPFIIGILVIAVVAVVAQIALIYLASGTEMDIKSALKRAKGKFWTFLALALLLALTIIGGFILVIIPGIIFLVWFGFSYYALLLESLQPVDSMKKSKSYVKGRFWPVLWRLLVLWLVMVPFMILSNLGGEDSFLSFVVNAIVAIFVGPFAIVYSYHLYKNLKETVSHIAQPQPSAPVQV